jgi:hypothetical protein
MPVIQEMLGEAEMQELLAMEVAAVLEEGEVKV